MRFPKPDSTYTSWGASNRVLTVHHAAFLPQAALCPSDVSVSVPLGLEYSETPPSIIVRFPHTSHISVGTPIVFDVFLCDPPPRDHSYGRGYTINRYQLDIPGLKRGVPQDLSDLQCSLSVIDTFTLKYEPTVGFRFPIMQDENPIDPAHPLDITGFINVPRSPSWRYSLDVPTAFTAYLLVPHQDPNKPEPDSHRAGAWSHIGSADVDRPTTVSVQFVTVYNTVHDQPVGRRVVCSRTGRGVVRIGSPVSRDDAWCEPGIRTFHAPQYTYTYSAFDYVHC